MRRLAQISCLVVTVLGRNLFSVNEASRNSIFCMSNPRLDATNFTVPLQELGLDLYYFSLDITDGATRRGWQCRLRLRNSTNLWHRRPEHLDRKSLGLRKRLDSNGVSFDGPVPDCGVCGVGKNHQLAHPKRTDHKIKRPIHLIFAHSVVFLTPEALRDYKYVAQISDEFTKWTETYLLKSKHDALSLF